MGRRTKVPGHLAAKAALARASRHPSSATTPHFTNPSESQHALKADSLSDLGPVDEPKNWEPNPEISGGGQDHEYPGSEPVSGEECSWNGTVNHAAMSDSESDWKSAPDGDSDSDSDLSELEGTDLINSLENELEQEIAALAFMTPYQELTQPISSKDWKKAERNRALGYSGLSDRVIRRKKQEKRENATKKEESLKSAAGMKFVSYFTKISLPAAQEHSRSPSPSPPSSPEPFRNNPVFTGYISDLPSDEPDASSDEADDEGDKPPPTKRVRRKLDVPARTARILAQEERKKEKESGLRDIEKLIGSKRTEFDAGANSLQAHRARSIQSVLHMLRSFVRSNKWAMDPNKLAEFSKNNLVSSAASKYLKHVVNIEMPKGLKKYMDLELFPRLHLKPGRGISLPTAIRWLHREGFRYTEHKKALYYDGHDRPDVVDYRQTKFLPQMEVYRRRLVEYTVGDVDVQMQKPRGNYVERELVLGAHDEMTAQANDGKKKSWILDGEHALKKKGVGRGMHQSDVILSTVGWLSEASQSMEYGKNYEGYWTGEMFVKQIVDKIIPAFECAHGPGYQLLLMVDNSQGHAAYALDALLPQRMNMNPGGKQAIMRPGWFIKDGEKVSQVMVFPADHPKYPGQAKGMKQVLAERGLFRPKLLMQCPSPKNDVTFPWRIMASASDGKVQFRNRFEPEPN
ncbi:hypothetical protein B0H17DRAFT_1152613 [Mycena rosella]|uniref:DDE-1 domain-containing protein n=1 Tax=Mycena rosella TaxID=1033263 RepID=A0AAD7FD43_MYCRO|nr:hypothetical protein B0H17DRAFT_1152613 [Mycena rosella]